MNKIEELIPLVIRASLPGVPDAEDYWNKAISLMKFEDWPGEVSRLSSCFYGNHRGDIERGRVSILKGVYKNNWSRNSLGLSALIPLLKKFDEDEIDYRLIKGGALILYVGLIGIRRMGDLDLVVAKKNQRVVRLLLEEKGFVQRYPGDLRGNITEIWESSTGIVLDVHFVKRSDFLNCAFAGCIIKSNMNYGFKLPDLECSLLIASRHGILGHSRGDFAQAVWDISMICKDINESRLARIVSRYGVLEEVQVFFRYLDLLGFQSPELKSLPFSRWKVQAFLNSVNSIVSNVTSVLNRRVFNFRIFQLDNISVRDVKSIEWKYLLWGSLGMLRPLERMLINRGGIIAKNRKLDFSEELNILVKPPLYFWDEKSYCSRSLFRNEFRIILRPPDQDKVNLEVQFNLESHSPRMVFIDGISHGHIASKEAGKYFFEIDVQRELLELSFRDFSKEPREWRGIIYLKWLNLSVIP